MTLGPPGGPKDDRNKRFIGPDGPEDKERALATQEPPADPAHEAKVADTITKGAAADQPVEVSSEVTEAAAEAKAKAKADAKVKEEAEEAAADEAKANAKAEAKAKEEAEEAAEDEAKAKAKAEAKAKKEAEKAAERAQEEKEDAEREAREAREALTKPPKAPPWYRTLRAEPPGHLRLLLAVGLIALLFGLWWFTTRGYDVQMSFNGRTKILEMKIGPSVDRIISVSKLPSPGEVFGSFDTLLERDLFKHITASLQRVAFGVGLAALVGILFGILAAAHRGVNAAMAPVVIFLRSVPMGALVPLTLMLFGDGETQKSRFLFLAIVPFVFSDTVKAVSIVPDRYIETAQTLGASRFQIIYKVLVPLSLPDIITSLRFQLGLGLGYIMLAEDIDTEFGLGKLISLSQRQGLNDQVYMTLFVIAAIAFTIDYFLRTIQRGAFSWRKDL